MRKQLIIVDIQKCFSISEKILSEVIIYAKKFKDIIFIYDKINTGDVDAIDEMYEEMAYSGLDLHMVNIGKEYGFFRDIMDSQRFEENQLLKLAKFMIKNNYYDSRDLPYSQWLKLVGPEYGEEDQESYCIYIPDQLMEFLQNHSKLSPELVGGGRNECLREIYLLLRALGKKPKIIERLTYG